MPNTQPSLLSLRAADVMSRDVVLLPADMSLQAAARMLDRLQISGAPVVDGDGRCIGVLSTTDFMHCIERRGAQAAPVQRGGEVYCAWEMPEEEEPAPASLVRDFMTREVVAVPTGTALADLARVMLEAHIHRLVVVDAAYRPVGIVSATDILAALARAALATSEAPGQFPNTARATC